MFDSAYKNKKVLVTGHTGFKGSWLTLWLKELGAEVVGLSNMEPTSPSNFIVSQVGSGIADIREDVTNTENLI